MAETFTNALSLAEAERLAILVEELGEAAQAVGKILRHGYESRNPDDPMSETNRHVLARELGDVEAAIEMLVSIGDFAYDDLERAKNAKLVKVRHYTHHQPEVHP